MIEFKAFHSSSAGNLYSLSNGYNSTLLIEAGLRLAKLRKAIGFKLSLLSGCLVTHSHGDHSKGCSDLLRSGVDCYMTELTARALKLSGHRLHIIEPMKQFNVDGWTVLPFPTIHDAPGSVGYLIERDNEKILFLTDTHYCQYRFNGLSIIAIEVNWSKETLAPDIHPAVKKRLQKNHMNLERAIRFFKATDLKNVHTIYLLHLSDSNANSDYFQKEIQKVTGLPVYIAGK